MRAVILAGGQGTRMLPYTTVLPKPLIPIGGRPILELILQRLASSGFSEVQLCVGHLGGLIRAYFEENGAQPEGMEIHYEWEDEPLGTAGALRQLAHPAEPFLVMNGDILTTLEYAELMRFHRQQGAALTIASFRKDVELALGVIESASETVTGYVEKPTLSYEVSMGIYAYDPSALGHIPSGHLDFPDLVLALLRAGEKVCKYRFDGEWFDIGTPDEYQRAVAAYEARPGTFDSAT